jgi:hypothetical protein
MGTGEFLLLEGMEIILYYLGTLEIITRQHRNIPMEYYCGTMGIITRRFRNIPLLSQEPGNSSHKGLGATTTKALDYSSDNNVRFGALCEFYRNFPIFY